MSEDTGIFLRWFHPCDIPARRRSALREINKNDGKKHLLIGLSVRGICGMHLVDCQNFLLSTTPTLTSQQEVLKGIYRIACCCNCIKPDRAETAHRSFDILITKWYI